MAYNNSNGGSGSGGGNNNSGNEKLTAESQGFTQGYTISGEYQDSCDGMNPNQNPVYRAPGSASQFNTPRFEEQGKAPYQGYQSYDYQSQPYSDQDYQSQDYQSQGYQPQGYQAQVYPPRSFPPNGNSNYNGQNPMTFSHQAASQQPQYSQQLQYSQYSQYPQYPQPMLNSNDPSPETPRVVLPPTPNHPIANGQTPTGNGRRAITPSPVNAPSSRQIITDPRQVIVDSPTFKALYAPIQTRGYDMQQPQQRQQPHINLTPPYVTPLKQQPQPKPPVDRVERQRILDMQAKGFDEEDDDMFYPGSG